MSGFVLSVLLKSLVGYVSFASFLCLLFAGELAFPRGQLPTLAERWKAIQFGLIFIPAFIIFGMLAAQLLAAIGARPLINLRPLPIIVAGLVFFLSYDFLYYWFHRAEHAFPWLWRIHAVHHSNEHLSAGFGYHHLAEAPLRAVLVAIPFGLLIGGGAGSAFLAFILMMHGHYIHSSSRVNFGPVAWLIADNRVHRIHHSLEPQHFGKNFGAATLLWDWLFGTAHFPRPHEWPGVGLAGIKEPQSISNYLLMPLSHPAVETDDRTIHEVTRR